MKILCVCQRGNSRSVCLAYLLKDKMNHDALSMGIESASKETQKMLYEWADRIALVDKRFTHLIPKEYQDKVRDLDVGPDRFFRGFEPELLKLFEDYLRGNTLWSTSA